MITVFLGEKFIPESSERDSFDDEFESDIIDKNTCATVDDYPENYRDDPYKVKYDNYNPCEGINTNREGLRVTSGRLKSLDGLEE